MTLIAPIQLHFSNRSAHGRADFLTKIEFEQAAQVSFPVKNCAVRCPHDINLSDSTPFFK
jgi:hypothetical protein